MAPPTPMVALRVAIAVEAICGGTTSRTMLMATGMNPMAMPCRKRPPIIGHTLVDRRTAPTRRPG